MLAACGLTASRKGVGGLCVKPLIGRALSITQPFLDVGDFGVRGGDTTEDMERAGESVCDQKSGQ